MEEVKQQEEKVTVKEIKIESALPEISVSLIVKDEAKTLPKLLNVLKGAADEIVVVDTGSVDDTLKIARDFGCIVATMPWEDNFSLARNVSLKLCTKPYVLWLDADDEIERQDIFKLKMHIHKQPGCAYWLRLIDVRDGQYYESMQLRVFPNLPFAEFRGRVHEQVSWSLEDNNVHYINLPDIMVFHKGYADASKLSQKLERNFGILLKDLEDNPEDFYVNLNVARTSMSLGRNSISEAAVEKAIELMTDPESVNVVSLENQVIAYLTKAILLGAKGEHKEAGKFLKSIRYRFPTNKVLKFTIGEIAFRSKNYDEAYRNLLDIRDKKLDLGAYPLDRNNTMKTLSWFLLFAALNVGDFKTAESVIMDFIQDKEFKIKRSN
jgi:glycosyltransferase involved in cell wall biosynthesis